MARRRTFGNLEKRKGRPGYSVRFRIQGRRIRRAAGATKTGARGKLAEVNALIDRGHDLEAILAEVFGEDSGAVMTFREAVPRYLDHARSRKRPSTIVSDVHRFRVLCRGVWSSKILDAICPADLDRWSAGRLNAGTAGSTINRDLSLASALFRWAMRLGYADSNPVTGVEKFSESGRERRTFLTAHEVRALVECAEPALRPILVTAVLAGMRRGEILLLRWRCIDFDARQIVVEAETAKAGRTRRIPMARHLEGVLKDLHGSQGARLDGSGPVYVLPDGSPVTVSVLRKMFRRARDRCEEIAIEKREQVTFHTLRHTCASLLQKAGVSLFEIGRILGHASIQTTLRYAHLFADKTRGAVDRLEDLLDPAPTGCSMNPQSVLRGSLPDLPRRIENLPASLVSSGNQTTTLTLTLHGRVETFEDE